MRGKKIISDLLLHLESPLIQKDNIFIEKHPPGVRLSLAFVRCILAGDRHTSVSKGTFSHLITSLCPQKKASLQVSSEQSVGDILCMPPHRVHYVLSGFTAVLGPVWEPKPRQLLLWARTNSDRNYKFACYRWRYWTVVSSCWYAYSN